MKHKHAKLETLRCAPLRLGALMAISGTMLASCQAADDAPKSQVKSSQVAASPSDAAAALTEMEQLYTGVLPWVARLYDPQSGGFYESLGTKAHPNGAPDIQSSYFAIDILGMAGLLETAPPATRTKMADYFQSRQNAQTGFFSDPGYPQMVENERVMGRALHFSQRGLTKLGAEPLYALPGAREVPLPERFASQENLKKWLDDRGWEQPWRALDAVSSQNGFLLSLPPEKRDPLVRFIYDYVVAKQDPETGFVGGDETIVQISGMAKFGWFCLPFDLPLPRADADYASVMKWYRSKPNVRALTMIRNPIHHLLDLEPFLSKPMPDEDKVIVVRETARMIQSFRQPDGAFGMYNDSYPLVPNGLWPNLGKADGPQSDLNGTSQARVIRGKAYQMMETRIPPMPGRDGFWEKMELQK